MAHDGQTGLGRWDKALRLIFVAVAVGFFALHFVHLRADFPNDSPWMDWAKYTDEGWYGDGAIRHFVLGHWYVAGDFNPAVVMPVWPVLLGVVFRFTGVSLVAARALAVSVFGSMVVVICLLLRDAARATTKRLATARSWALPVAALLLCTNAFLFAFDRLAILEPLVAALAMLTLLTASKLQQHTAKPDRRQRQKQWALLVSLGLLTPAMVLTKTTAVALFPAIGYMLWCRAGRSAWQTLKLAAVPVLLSMTLWAAYFVLLVRPHYLEDYRYLFSANAYTGFQLQPLATVLFNTFSDGFWIGTWIYGAFLLCFLLAVVFRPGLLKEPLPGALLVWVAGYFVFLAYHNNLQPRYYLVPAVAMIAFTALVLAAFLNAPDGTLTPGQSRVRLLAVLLFVLGIAAPEITLQIGFVRHPEYSFLSAARAIAAVVHAHPEQSPVVLSISGSDLTLMTGLPSIDDDFGTLDLDQRIERYRPGWYIAWNQIEDDKMDALAPLYRPVRVASFPAMDDPERNQLILYRLDGAQQPAPLRRRRSRLPRQLRTKLGQQPTTNQLQH